MFTFAEFPSEKSAHFHAIAVVHTAIVYTKLFLDDMAHLNEAPYLIERGDVLRLQAIYSVVERVGTAQQIPCAIHLTVAGCFLQYEAFLRKSFETPDGAEKRIALQVLQGVKRLAHLRLHGFRRVFDGFDASFQLVVFGGYLPESVLQETVFLGVVALHLLLGAIEVRRLTAMLG